MQIATMTALIAIFSTVAAPIIGGTCAETAIFQEKNLDFLLKNGFVYCVFH